MNTKTILAPLAATLAAVAFGAIGASANPTPESAAALPRCAFDVVVIAPNTNLNCDIQSSHRIDMVGINAAQCNQHGGNWGWRLQRCFNIDG